MKQGCSLIIINDQEQILLLLRDNIPTIPYPNMWDVIGGSLEGNETPEQCIIREIKEEMDIDIVDIQLFEINYYPFRKENTFWKKINLDIETINLNEGQRLKWFNKYEIENTTLAYEFNPILNNFFQKKPFKKKK